MEQPLDTKVKDWLLGSGFSVEMDVARAFRSGGFRVSQADYYEDHSTKVQREIDVVESQRRTFEGGEVQISICVECKTARDKPWVLFVSHEGSAHEDAWTSRIRWGCNNKRGDRLRRMLAAAKEGSRPEFLAYKEVSAYGVVQALGNRTDRDEGGDPSYSAVMQAVKATVSLTREWDIKESNAAVWQNEEAKIGFPVVVTSGRLFTALLAADGSGLKVAEVESHPLILRNRDSGTDWAFVWVVTRAGLERFVQMTVELEKWISAVCVADPARLVKAIGG